MDWDMYWSCRTKKSHEMKKKPSSWSPVKQLNLTCDNSKVAKKKKNTPKLQKIIKLVVEPTHLKNIGQNGNLPQIRVKIKMFETTSQSCMFTFWFFPLNFEMIGYPTLHLKNWKSNPPTSHVGKQIKRFPSNLLNLLHLPPPGCSASVPASGSPTNFCHC